MTAPRIRADHDQLARIASSFGREAQNTQRSLQRIKRQVDQLQGGDWIGKGAKAFYAEMDQDVLPALTRLTQALAQARVATAQISKIMQQAEEEAARLLRVILSGNGRGAAGGGPGAGGASGWRDWLKSAATGLSVATFGLKGLGRLATNVADRARLVMQQRWQKMASVFARGGEAALEETGVAAAVARWTTSSARASQLAEGLGRWSDRLGKVGAGVTALDQGVRSSAETWLGKITSGGAAGAFALGVNNPYVAAADMAGLALGLDGPSQIMNSSFESIVVTTEGLITGSPAGMSNLHQRQLAGEWGPLFREAAEAGDFWAEHGVVGGMGMFWDAVTDSF